MRHRGEYLLSGLARHVVADHLDAALLREGRRQVRRHRHRHDLHRSALEPEDRWYDFRTRLQ